MIWITLTLALAQNPPAMPDNTETVKKLEWMIGHWSGSGEQEQFGKYTDEYTFEWTLNKNFVKVTQTVNSPDMTLWHSTGLLGWDVMKKQFLWFQFGLDGTIGWVRSKDDKVDDVVVMEGQLTGGGPFANFRTTFKKNGKDAMHSKVEFKGDKEDTLFYQHDLKRVEKAPEHKVGKMMDEKVAEANAEKIKKFDWMIGTWIGSGDMPGFGKFESEFTFAKIEGDMFVKHDYTMRVDGKVVWHDTGITGYDVDKKKYVNFAFGMDGTIGWGEEVKSEGDTSSYEGETFGPNESGQFRSSLTKVDADTMSFKCEMKKGDEWKDYGGETSFKRKK